MRTIMLVSALLIPTAAAAQVLHEVPLSVEAPGFREVVRAWHDGESFHVDVPDLFRRLGYRVTVRGVIVEALDATRRIEVDFALERASTTDGTLWLKGEMLLSGDRRLLTTDGIERLFGPDVRFDERRLELRISSAAEAFTALKMRPAALLDAPGPVLFGRSRQLLGGVIATYHVSRQARFGRETRHRASVDFTGNVLGGAVRGRLGDGSEITWLLGRPASKLLTRFEFGRMRPAWAHETLEAIRLSNLPLAARQLQRTARWEGHAEPHALVEAVVSGRVVDRVEADAEGRFVLAIPARYGSTEVLLRETPLGAAPPRTRRRFFFASPDLAQPGRIHYDAWAARTHKRRVFFGRAEWGLLPRLTVRVSGGPKRALRVGASGSPFSFALLRADADLLRRWYAASARLWRRNLTAEASYEVDRVRRFRAHASGSLGGLGGHISASSVRLLGSPPAVHVAPSLAWYGKRGLDIGLSLAAERHGPEVRTLTYRAAAGQVVMFRRATGRLSAFAEGGARRRTGLEGYLSVRQVSLGFHAAWDAGRRDFAGGLSLRLETPVGTLGARGDETGHRLTGFGSVELGRRPRLLRGGRHRSGAVLRIFEDLDSDGARDTDEPIARTVEAQMQGGGLERQRDGTLRARHLEPYAVYQVRIVERSIRDPLLRPATGWAFGFVADPGHTKIVDIPLVRATAVEGIVRAPGRAPSRLQVRAFESGELKATADVHRDGGFSLHLEAGHWVLRLHDAATLEELGSAPLVIARGQRSASVTITPSGGEGR